MKNSIILLIGVIGILCSCSEVDVTDYSSDNFIQFAKAAKDSTVFSFAYDQTMSAGTGEVEIELHRQPFYRKPDVWCPVSG